MIRIGTLICFSAQGVELLLVHQSMSLTESLARMALLVRKDVSVRNKVPFDRVLSSFAFCVTGTRTERTTSVTIEPSFLSSLRGSTVPGCTLIEKSLSRARAR